MHIFIFGSLFAFMDVRTSRTHTLFFSSLMERSLNQLTSMASALPAPTPSPFLYCSEEKTKKKDRDWSRKTSRTMEALNTCLCLQLELGSCFRRGINRIPSQLTSGSKINQRIGLAMERTPVDGAPPSKETIDINYWWVHAPCDVTDRTTGGWEGEVLRRPRVVWG